MILNKDVLVSNIVTEISDNSTGQISPYDIRHNLLDIIDSVHLLTTGKPLDGSNFGTPAIRSVRVGEDSLAKLYLAGYFSIDNTAVGHSALRSNYQSVKNTAIGSHSLFCNVYGEHNVAVGYSSLAGNTVGIGNIGVGNYTLHNNKGGDFNIAIGHGAGYYIPNDTDNKLVIGSHPIDSGYICDNPQGSGLIPLLYGDLSELRLGVAVRNLHSEATLQVSGNISPAHANISDLGSPNYRFKRIYLSSGIYFGNNLNLRQYNDSSLSVYGDLVPEPTLSRSLGSYDNLWASGLFHNIYVSGVATINRFVALENCNYFCKTINLATSGNISLDGGGPDSLYDYSGEASPLVSNCGYLADADLSGAGLNIHSSGASYLRLYSFTFAPPDYTLTCLQDGGPYARSSWNSNISLHINSGCHVRTDRIIFPSSINIVNSSGCFGIYSRGSGLFFTESDLIVSNTHPSGYLAGIGNVNFLATSGDSSDYIVNFSSPESGVVVKHRILTGIKNKSLDNLNNNLDKLRGFEFQYIDDALGYSFGPNADRLVVGSYNNTSQIVNALTLMKTNSSEGIVGITNLTPNSKNILPSTSLNIRSATNAIGRFTAENIGSTRSAIQLLGTFNCLYDGFEAAYLNGSGLADLSMYKDSGKSIFLRFYENNTLGLFTSSGTSNEMFTIGDSFYKNAIISMYQYSGGNIPSTPGYGKIHVKSKIVQNHQSQSLYLFDSSGNLHDLVVNKLDATDGRGLYTDQSRNTFGGLYCPQDRRDIVTNLASGNTALGFKALNQITNGDFNTIIGCHSATGITTGDSNIIIGSNSANRLISSVNNVILGNNIFSIHTGTDSSNNIIIGNSGVGDHILGSANYRYIVGCSSGVVLLDGILGPSNGQKTLSMPKGGKFLVNDNTDTDSLQIRANYIDVIDRGGLDYPNNTLTFSFTGNETADLLSLNHSAEPMSNNPQFTSPIPLRPFAQLQGDLKLRGAIRFSNSTSLDSASFLTDIDNLGSGLVSANNNISQLFGSFVEGYVLSQIDAPSTGSSPTSGILYTKNQNWNNNGSVTLINRDSTSIIHSGAYVIAIRVNNEFRPLWVSAGNTGQCCN